MGRGAGSDLILFGNLPGLSRRHEPRRPRLLARAQTLIERDSLAFSELLIGTASVKEKLTAHALAELGERGYGPEFPREITVHPHEEGARVSYKVGVLMRGRDLSAGLEGWDYADFEQMRCLIDDAELTAALGMEREVGTRR
jgi:hypothetical protein